MASDWAHTIQLAKEVRELHKRIKDLEEIEEEHRKLNGELRIEVAAFKNHYKLLTGQVWVTVTKEYV